MNSVAKYGVILGIIGIVLQMILYVMGPAAMVGTFYYVMQIITFGLFIYFGIQLRKENGGYFTFGEAFKGVYLMGVVFTVLIFAFSWVLYNVIEPDLASQISDAVIEQTVSMLEKFGTPQEQIDQTVLQLEEQDYGMELGNMLKGLGMFLGGGLIGAAIVAAIVKKRKPEELSF